MQRCDARRGSKKGRHLRFLPSLNTRFPWQPTLGADGRLRKQEKEYGRGFFLPRCIRIFAFRLPYCYTGRLLYAGAAQGELPEGQEKVL